MKLDINTMTEAEVKDTLEELQNVHNSLQQQLYKLKERIGVFQRVLLKKQEARILAEKAVNYVDTSQLEELSGLSREQILKAMTLIKHEQR